MTEYTLQLWENLKVSDTVIDDNITDRFPSWRDSIRSKGGCWHGEGEYIGSRAEMDSFFLDNLARRMVVKSGGISRWEGQIVRMEYTRNGQTFVRSMEDLANTIKIIYTKVGPNELSNGDVEGGAWAQVGSPSTHATTTTWFAKGTTAMHVVAAATNDGTQANSSAVTITASRPYTCSMVVYVVSGTWTLRVIDDASSTVIAQHDTPETGRMWLQCQVPDTNTYTSVDVQLIASAASAEVYADMAALRTAPERSESDWNMDSESRAVYGRIEGVFLEGEKTDGEVDAMSDKELANRAWPRTEAPSGGGTLAKVTGDKLTVTCLGNVWSLGWLHALRDGTSQCASAASALLDESEFFAASNAIIDTNTTEVLIESDNPIAIWRAMEKIIDAGSGGSPWMGGGYPGRQFRYRARPSGTQYQISKGMLKYLGGGIVRPVEFEPGWCLMSDMPVTPAHGAATEDDDPRRVWLDETWFIAENGKTIVEWTRERSDR